MSTLKSPPPGSVPGMMPLPEEALMGHVMNQKSNSSTSQQSNFQHQQTPREVSTVADEVARMGQDLFAAFKDLLGLGRPPKTQEELAQLQQFHQTWEGLTAEQQAAAQERIQKELERTELVKQEDEMKKAQAEQEAQQDELVIPQGKVSGDAALQKMQQDRKGMGGVSG